MNKRDLAEQIAVKVGVSKQQAEAMLDAFQETVTETLRAGGEVSLTGFGTFLTRRREARQGVNPQNPTQKIDVPAVTIPKFKAGKNLKEALR